jgi:NADH dehydrogenase/putative oxidoreductase
MTTVNAVQRRRANLIANLMGHVGNFLRLGEVTLSPFLDLFIRLWLAQIFWISGILKLSNWDNALYLAAHEYPVSWLDPVTAAYLGISIEVLCPIFMALGLATRLAAIPMLVLSLVIQFEYQALNQHLYWAGLFGWYAVMGAGSISLDRLLAPGLAASALPLVKPLGSLFEAIARYLGPCYRLFIRLWMASLLSGLIVTGFPALGWLTGGVIPALLALGVATRLTALSALLLLTAGWTMAVTELQAIDAFYWCLFLGLLLLQGPGPLALDHLFARQLRRRFPQLEGWSDIALEGLPHVVIVGAGFGGLKVARGLRLAACRITIIDRHNYHLFQPLLYQVATASLSPADIATPIRGMFRDQHNVRVLLNEVTGVDSQAQQVLMGDTRIHYDYLVLATGARHSYFGRDEWEPFAPGLKQIDDATAVRRRLLLAFEQAENTNDPAERQRLLTFVIVGGGPTGVELAGAIAELARHGMAGEFRNIDPATAQVLLVQSAARLLPAFPEKLSAISEQSLRQLGVQVLTNSRVEQVDAEGVVVSGRRIGARTVFWAAGVVASSAAEWLKVTADSAGRIKVNPDLSVPGLENIFAIGDTALINAWDGKPVPGLAPAAKQQGLYVAKVIRARLEGRKVPPPFRYHHLGNLATIGRKSAVVDFGLVQFSGTLAWWFWGILHILFLVEVRKRLAVALEWFWAYLTFRRGTRLITGTGVPAVEAQVITREASSHEREHPRIYARTVS